MDRIPRKLSYSLLLLTGLPPPSEPANIQFFRPMATGLTDTVIKRRHTINAKRDPPSIVAEVVEPLRAARQAQNKVIEVYHNTPLTDAQADHAIMALYRAGVINVQRIANVWQQWENPEHDWAIRPLGVSSMLALSYSTAELPRTPM